MNDQFFAGAEFVEKIQGFMVTAHQDVLPIIDKVSAVSIRKRVGAPAEGRFSFEQCDAESALGERNRGTQAGEATANYNDVVRCHFIAGAVKREQRSTLLVAISPVMKSMEVHACG